MATEPELDWNDEAAQPGGLKAKRFWQKFSNKPSGGKSRWQKQGFVRWGGFGLVVSLLGVAAYYLIGMVVIHKISDDVDFAVETAAGESRTVAMAAGLIEREVRINRWTANDPWTMPSILLDNMPNYQQGIVYALSRFAIEMSDQIGRTRGSSEVDKNLDKAAGLLKYPGNIWVFDFSTSLIPTATSENQYLAARAELLAYNKRLAQGQAVFDRRADNLLATLERFAADIGSSSATIDQHLTDGAELFVDVDVDDIFYRTKGRLYAYYLLLREMSHDFQSVLRERQVEAVYLEMLNSLRLAAQLDPLIVVGGTPDGLYFPNHLAVQGFYLLRARTQLREIVNILQK